MHLLALALLPNALAEDLWPPATRIDEAAAIQLTPTGLDAIGELAGALIPADFPIADQAGGSYNSSWPSCLYSWGYSLENMFVGIEAMDIRILPQPSPSPGVGSLQLEADLQVWVNLPNDKFVVSYGAVCIDGDCEGYVNRFPVAVSAPILLEIDDSGPEPVVNATVGQVDYTFELEGAIAMDGCLGGFNDFLVDYLGFDLYDYLIDLVVPYLDPMIQSFAADIESQLEDALKAANFEDTLDVNGVPVHVHLYPKAVNTGASGVEVVIAGQVDAPQSDCTADYGVLGSLRTATPIPSIASLPGGTQAMFQLSDDVVNQAAYAAWSGGLLCYTLPDPAGGLDLPVPMNTTLLGILAGDAFDDIFPETKPLVIQTAPRTAPLVDYNAGPDVLVKAHDLDVNFFAEFDHRMGRALGVTVNADVPIGLAFNGATGELAIDVELNGAIGIDAANNELVPSRNAEIEEGMGSLLSTLIDSFAGDSLSNLKFALPSMNGFGLTSLSVDPQGPQGDWLGASAKLGAVTYDAGGSGCSGGCGSTGGACSTSAPGALAWPLAVLAGALMRRRRRA